MRRVGALTNMHRRYLTINTQGLDGPEFYVAIDKMGNGELWLSIHMEVDGVVRDQRVNMHYLIDALREMGWACFAS